MGDECFQVLLGTFCWGAVPKDRFLRWCVIVDDWFPVGVPVQQVVCICGHKVRDAGGLVVVRPVSGVNYRGLPGRFRGPVHSHSSQNTAPVRRSTASIASLIVPHSRPCVVLLWVFVTSSIMGPLFLCIYHNLFYGIEVHKTTHLERSPS